MIMENEIIEVIKEKGPLTGAELQDAVNGDSLILWRTCQLAKDLAIRIVGTRYLRLDRRVEDYARLSPSILREFLTYSVIGLSSDHPSLARRADQILLHIEEVSRAKSEMAYSIVSTLVSRLTNELLVKEKACFIIAGDIVYNMAHDVPRPERSTGKLVKGSDMDIVVIVDDLFPEELMERLDEEIYKEKYKLLINPYLREEIDYIIKDLDRVRMQVKFDTFKHIVACKILCEGTLLYGSDELFNKVKMMIREHGVIKKIDAMESEARIFRREAIKYLLSVEPRKIKEESLYLFYPTEESEEFE